jgi:hypothetical protein
MTALGGVTHPETSFVFGGTPRLPSWPGEECDGRDLCLARCTNRTSCAVIVTLADITSLPQESLSPADWEGFHGCVEGCGEP